MGISYVIVGEATENTQLKPSKYGGVYTTVYAVKCLSCGHIQSPMDQVRTMCVCGRSVIDNSITLEGRVKVSG